MLMSCCSSFCRSSRSGCERGDVVADSSDIGPRGEPQDSCECAATDRQFQALGRGVQVSTAAGGRAARIRYDARGRPCRVVDDSQQLALSGPVPTSDAGPDRSGDGP